MSLVSSSFSFQANLVAAFEQSLVNMTSRLRQLAETAEEKVSPVRGQAASEHLQIPLQYL